MGSSRTRYAQRQFAPLKDGATNPENLPVLKGVVFDMDGTLCIPQTYMFGQMRSSLSIDKSVDILTHIYSLPTPTDQQEAMCKIQAIEREAMAHQTPQPGLTELMSYLTAKGIQKAICTRNFDGPVNHLLGKFLPEETFGPIVTREFRPPKPAPEGIWFIAEKWGLGDKEGRNERETEQDRMKKAASGLIMVGDSIDDMTAGFTAGAATVLLVNDGNAHLATHEHTDLCISRLDELIGVLENGFVGRMGADEDGVVVDVRGRAEKVLKEGKGEI